MGSNDCFESDKTFSLINLFAEHQTAIVNMTKTEKKDACTSIFFIF
jgi:hypothetical protein